MNLYFDTSALIKLVVAEEGSDVAAELWATRHRAASSLLAYPEGRAALASARRAGRLTAAMHRQALQDFEAVHTEIALTGLDKPLARHAGALADDLGLRGYDAVHLASALLLGDDTVLVTWDTDLRHAARTTGLAIAPA